MARNAVGGDGATNFANLLWAVIYQILAKRDKIVHDFSVCVHCTCEEGIWLSYYVKGL